MISTTRDPRQRLRRQVVLQGLLRDARKAAGIRQRTLADRLGEHQSFISKYESGERRLDVLELREICRALDISFVEFVSQLDDRLEDGA